MAQSTVANFFVPELLADAVKIGLVGAKILAGSSAVVYRTNMPNGDVRVGETINIPYFASLGELEDVADGAALTEVGNSSTAQQATVQRSGKLIGFTDWARYGAGGGDPYQHAVSQIVELVVRRADRALIDLAATPLAANANLIDVYNDGTGTIRKIDYDLVTDARMAFGDEMEDVSMLAVHSKVFGDLLKLKDSQGRPLTVDSFRDGQLPTFCGIPVKVSDRLPRLTTGLGSPTYPKYTSLVLKKGALAFWIDGGVGMENFRDIARAKDQTAINVYWAAHRYTQMSGGTKCGVEVVAHNGTA